MIKHDQADRIVTVSNNSLKIALSYAEGVCFQLIENLHSPSVNNGEFELIQMQVHGKALTSKDFVVSDVICVSDEVYELVTLLLTSEQEELKIRLHLINDGKDSISVLYQVWDDYLFGVPSVVKVHLPLLSSLNCGEGDHRYYPSCTKLTKKGADVVCGMRESFFSSDILRPLVICDSKEQYGYSIEFPVHSDLSDTGSAQNVNKILTGIDSETALKNHCLQINPDPSFNDTIEMRITGLKNGWVEAFERYREIWRSNYDFSEYRKPDLQWFNECVVNNFVFLYGSEGFNHETGKVDVEGLLKQGEEFGGYDTVTIWNMYPRLGVDTKSQWDFNDEFPGGRKALREMVDEFHKHSVKVFLPYIPWDQHDDMNTDEMGDEFAQIVADTDADGFQLDTLNSVPYSYRKKLDAIRPGIILTTQQHPAKKHPTEYITTSWDEFWRTDPMPELDIFRFMCPEHIAPVISRWLRLEDKDTLVKRCEFGGAPIVIWQDIFGRWMPFTVQQKERIKKWKQTYLAHRDVYQGAKPIPLYPTFADDLYCNVFVDDKGDREIYSFYNDSAEACTVNEMKLRKAFSHAEVILGSGESALYGDHLTVTVAPHEVLHVLVK